MFVRKLHLFLVNLKACVAKTVQSVQGRESVWEKGVGGVGIHCKKG
jgi:hypothetical protein